MFCVRLQKQLSVNIGHGALLSLPDYDVSMTIECKSVAKVQRYLTVCIEILSDFLGNYSHV